MRVLVCQTTIRCTHQRQLEMPMAKLYDLGARSVLVFRYPSVIASSSAFRRLRLLAWSAR